MTDALAEWRSRIDPALTRLRDVELPAGFPFDFSPESLAQLESVLLARFLPGAGVGHNADFTEAAVMYVGEALLRVGGGRWQWEVDTPVVAFDQALALVPVAPLGLLARAVQSRTADVLVQAHAAVLEAVSEQQMQTPGWTPTVRLPADDADTSRPPQPQ